eukprot:TRINITY_DN7584_c0_g1_i1.p1 TRINITY_DN7584_c0_g1~~TRINITY_DN7584_c0_g1_i1.p1  ORF type:complete len:634 (-),score=134.22 TRINITY_DN7584_c0_g1_i1:7-1908(-)
MDLRKERIKTIWKCTYCGCENTLTARKCVFCNTSRPEPASGSVPASMPEIRRHSQEPHPSPKKISHSRSTSITDFGQKSPEPKPNAKEKRSSLGNAPMTKSASASSLTSLEEAALQQSDASTAEEIAQKENERAMTPSREALKTFYSLATDVDEPPSKSTLDSAIDSSTSKATTESQAGSVTQQTTRVPISSRIATSLTRENLSHALSLVTFTIGEIVKTPVLSIVCGFLLFLILNLWIGPTAIISSLICLAIIHYSQMSHAKRHDLLRRFKIQENNALRSDLRNKIERDWINKLILHWWKNRSEAVTANFLSTVEASMNKNPPKLVKSIKMGSFIMGGTAPVIDQFLKHDAIGSTMIVDMSLHFAGETEFTFRAHLSDLISVGMKIRGIKFQSKMRLEVLFLPHKSAYSISCIEKPVLDFSVFPLDSSLDLTTIPGLSDWLHHVADESLKNYLVEPNKFAFYQAESDPRKSLPTQLPSIQKDKKKRKDVLQEPQSEKIASRKEAYALFGVTPETIEYVENLAQNEELFLKFPLDGYKQFALSKRQERHAMLMMKVVPRLGTLRYKLCPTRMDDRLFWFVYFSLLRKRLKMLDDQPNSSEQVDADWNKVQNFERHQQARDAHQRMSERYAHLM